MVRASRDRDKSAFMPGGTILAIVVPILGLLLFASTPPLSPIIVTVRRFSIAVGHNFTHIQAHGILLHESQQGCTSVLPFERCISPILRCASHHQNWKVGALAVVVFLKIFWRLLNQKRPNCGSSGLFLPRSSRHHCLRLSPVPLWTALTMLLACQKVIESVAGTHITTPLPAEVVLEGKGYSLRGGKYLLSWKIGATFTPIWQRGRSGSLARGWG